MSSSVDMMARHGGRAALSEARPLAWSRRAVVTWPANPDFRQDKPIPLAEISVEPLRAPVDMAVDGLAPIRLGTLEILPGARMLMVNGAATGLGSRAFDLLMVLLRARGEIVSRETIMQAVWPTTTVVQSNLKVQLSSLRRALGPERWRVKTVSGRGYLLVADDHPASDQDAGQSPVSTRPLIIIVDADLGTQQRVMHLVSSAASGLDGITRLTLIAGNPDQLEICK